MRPQVFLKKGEGRTIRAGGLWIYDNEILKLPDDMENGGLVDVFSVDGYFLGTGFINIYSKICIRLLTRKQDEKIDYAFFKKRVSDAWNYRKQTMGEIDTIGVKGKQGEILFHGSCRVIFGEADFLPGIVVDKYADICVVQSLALGIDRLKEMIIACLKEVLMEDGIFLRGIYERSDAKVREQEKMERVAGFLGQPFDTKVEIVENKIRYLVDVAQGQKTGFFLDQKYNRKAIWNICKQARVLDCFTHTGSFALNAGAAKAREVLGVDASALAINQAKENAALNGFEERVHFVCADVFELLPQLLEQKELFDVVILDPPAFTKSRASVKKAVKGYKEINLRGMKLIKEGGYLVTCSCSHFMTPSLFQETIERAAKDAHKRLRQVEFRTQAPDHPILWSAEESYYLKFYIFQVCEGK